jgi:hypothetical protein
VDVLSIVRNLGKKEDYPMGDKELNVLLMIADISGYTKFMISNKQSLTHSQMIITELTKTILKQVEIPFEVSKLEGDAIFMYAVKSESEQSWELTSKTIGNKILRFMDIFSDKVKELSESNVCGCAACSNVSKLKLKLVIHSGRALIYQLGKFEELSGVDVILVHRLLKNSIQSNEYVLMSETAFNEIIFPSDVQFHQSKEYYEEIGDVKTVIYLPYNESQEQEKYDNFFYKMINEYKKIVFTLFHRRKNK